MNKCSSMYVLHVFFIKMKKKHVFVCFYLQINVLNICGTIFNTSLQI